MATASIPDRGHGNAPKRSARARALFVVLGLALAACGPANRAPASAQREAPDAGAAADEEDEGDQGDQGDQGGEEPGASDVAATADDEASPAPCPANMVLVESGELRFCIDKYEASLVEVDGDGNEKPFPHWLPVDGRSVRAVSEPDVFPQGFVSEVQAEDACAASGKRLCSHGEWKTACMGPAKTTFPYGDARRPGACHDTGRSAVGAVFGARALADPVARAPSKPAATGNKAAATAARGSTARGSTARGAATAARGGTKPAPAGGKAGATAARGAAARGAPPAGAPKPGKPARQAHATTKGRAAVTTKARPARPGKAAAKAEAPAKKTAGKRDGRPKPAAKGAPRVAARSSARPASVEPSVWTQLNDPRLGQVEGALSKTGSHEECVNDYGAFDMVGNLHEWVKTDPSAVHGTFAGGYYLDTTLNGDGCGYRTTAHAHDYHDYSTGFRCCAEAAAPPPTPIVQD